jgi:hypothetical protein
VKHVMLTNRVGHDGDGGLLLAGQASCSMLSLLSSVGALRVRI